MKCQKYHRFFETIASKPRWTILELLMQAPKTVTEICKELNEEQSKVSHNLKKLADCNIISAEQIGKTRRYSLNKDTFIPLLELVGKHVHKHCTGCNKE